jgi:hypothetical protein
MFIVLICSTFESTYVSFYGNIKLLSLLLSSVIKVDGRIYNVQNVSVYSSSFLTTLIYVPVFQNFFSLPKI